MPNTLKATPQKKGKVIVSLRRSGNISEAARLVGVHRATLYAWQQDDSEFAAEWHNAKLEYCDRLEHAERPHQGLGGVFIQSSNDHAADGPLVRQERLGGLLNYYYREAA